MELSTAVTIFLIIVLGIKMWLYIQHIHDPSIIIHIFSILSILITSISVYRELYTN